MQRKMNYCNNVIVYFIIAFVIICTGIISPAAFAEPVGGDTEPKELLIYRPGIRFGSDSRVLYINDFFVPVYRGENNIFFVNPKFTPNDHDGWEVNIGAGYRHILLDDSLILGVNAFYDNRRTPWGTRNEQWGVGAEVMTEIPLADEFDLGLTGRFNYYVPISDADISLTPREGVRYIFKGHGIYAIDPLVNAYIEEPLGGFDAELGFRVPYVSDYVETWLYGGGYHFEGDYVDSVDGFMARVEVVPTDFLRLNYEFRSDRTDREQHYGEVSVEIPFSIDNLIAGKNPFAGIGERFGGSRTLPERMTEPVRRDVDVVVEQIIGNAALEELLKWGEFDPQVLMGGKQTENVFFVSEDGDDLGNGSFDSPYKSIGRVFEDTYFIDGPYDLVYVMNTGDDSTVKGNWVRGYTNDITDPYYQLEMRGLIRPYSRKDFSTGYYTYDPVADLSDIEYYGSVNKANVTIWGSGVSHEKYNPANMVNMPLGYPTIDTHLTINAPDTTVTGLRFVVTKTSDPDYSTSNPYMMRMSENGGIVVVRGDDVNIWNNYFIVNDGNCGITTSYRLCFDANNSEEFPLKQDQEKKRELEFANSNGLLTIEDNDFIITEDGGNGINIVGSDPGQIEISDNNFIGIDADSVNGIKMEYGDTHTYTINTDVLRCSILDNEFFLDGRKVYGINAQFNDMCTVMHIRDNIFNITGNDEAYGIKISSAPTNIEVLTDVTAKIVTEYITYRILNRTLLEFSGTVISEAIDVAKYFVKNEIDRYSYYPLYAYIYNNNFDIETNGGNSYGIYMKSNDSILAVIRNNYMLSEDGKDYGVKSICGDAYGIYLKSNEGIFNYLRSDVHSYINNNVISVESIMGDAYGLHGKSDGVLSMHIGESGDYLANTFEIKAGESAYGINLESPLLTGSIKQFWEGESGEINTNSRPIEIVGNDIYSISSDNDAFGIRYDMSHFSDTVYNFILKKRGHYDFAYVSILDNDLIVGSHEGDVFGLDLKLYSIRGSISNSLYAHSDEGDVYGTRISAEGSLEFNFDLNGLPQNINNNYLISSDFDLGSDGGNVYGLYIEDSNSQYFSGSSRFSIGADEGPGLRMSSEEGSVYGYKINETSDDSVGYVHIVNSRLDILGKKNSYGIEAMFPAGYIKIKNNHIKVTSEEESAYGCVLKFSEEESFITDIEYNNFYAVGNDDAVAFKIESEGSVGNDESHAGFHGNSLIAEADDGDAIGLLIEADESIYVNIWSIYDYISNETIKTRISAETNNGNAYGIFLDPDVSLDLMVKNSLISAIVNGPAGSSSDGEAFGISSNIDKKSKNQIFNIEIENNVFTVEGIKNSAAMRFAANEIYADIKYNEYCISSTEGLRAGIVMLANKIEAEYHLGSLNDSNEYFDYAIIDAVIRTDIDTLNYEIENGETGWIYVPAGKYEDMSYNVGSSHGEGLSLIGLHSKVGGFFFKNSDVNAEPDVQLEYTVDGSEDEFLEMFLDCFNEVVGIDIQVEQRPAEWTLVDLHDPAAVVKIRISSGAGKKLAIDGDLGTCWKSGGVEAFTYVNANWEIQFSEPKAIKRIEFLPLYLDGAYGTTGEMHSFVQGYAIECQRNKILRDIHPDDNTWEIVNIPDGYSGWIWGLYIGTNYFDEPSLANRTGIIEIRMYE